MDEDVVFHGKSGWIYPLYTLPAIRETIDFNQKPGECYTSSRFLPDFYGKVKSYPHSYDNTMDNF